MECWDKEERLPLVGDAGKRVFAVQHPQGGVVFRIVFLFQTLFDQRPPIGAGDVPAGRQIAADRNVATHRGAVAHKLCIVDADSTSRDRQRSSDAFATVRSLIAAIVLYK
ncbi:uncharacterized protein MONOS_14310 [Monocercomonoides exilis]|uniref:uncharacterized protein n=1 Tax=Monocercomonoides exilis TaxID=2049356 RepID=UPI00355A5F48|nr:hypothetical protein MONOS_14310 [Monocercomonoides exilis]|eukprot:MONOS_14310.1-p1 / transcript=MONOS_14310.1 / gene=MONOS_14310 / organism=Monocercomonoides_exilis_PA203 / gene_product=unspecified product / transcript_product=unspecified product / location=Mono_scaffold00977:11666-11995(+) / protein_length=110 / sequence_SO=supercontig / SO=protein_coding / is_pseudo=false